MIEKIKQWWKQSWFFKGLEKGYKSGKLDGYKQAMKEMMEYDVTDTMSQEEKIGILSQAHDVPKFKELLASHMQFYVKKSVESDNTKTQFAHYYRAQAIKRLLKNVTLAHTVTQDPKWYTEQRVTKWIVDNKDKQDEDVL